MSARITIDVLRSFLATEILERAYSGRGGLLIDAPGLGIVGDVLERMPKERVEDVFLVRPENERYIGLLPAGSAERLIAVLNALNPTLGLKRFELDALKVFALHTSGAIAARAIDIRPANVKNQRAGITLPLN